MAYVSATSSQPRITSGRPLHGAGSAARLYPALRWNGCLPNGAHDHQVDAMTQALLRWNMIPRQPIVYTKSPTRSAQFDRGSSVAVSSNAGPLQLSAQLAGLWQA